MTGARFLEKNVAIVGIGQSEVGRPSSRSAMQLTVDAALEAIADAGLQPKDIDGVCSWPGDNSNGSSFSPVGPLAVLSMFGLDCNWFSGGYEAAGPLAGVMNGAMAIASGMANNVLIFRTITESSNRTSGSKDQSLAAKSGPRDGNFMWQWCTPFNVLSVVNITAMYAAAHMDKYGTSPEQLAQIALNARRNALLNPKAVMRKPMTMDDYFNSKMISTPLRMFDCDVHCDASTAIVLTRRDRAKDLRNPPIRIEAIGAAMNQPYLWDQIDLTANATANAGTAMWARTDFKPSDVDTAQLYDGFSILTMMWLEGLGLCPRGESGAFVEGGRRIALDGELPLNTNGGQLSGGRTHGMGYVHEACTQLWGRGGDRQIRAPRVAVCAAGGGPLAGSLLLVKD
ncbi:thiolase family protein [Brevundimonas diminuta]|jgi:acetyl-CoA acetyltransferase|uniref:thiolase family protein n=2 Tax=Pseudomonadota TaxID=1224 RepID=UPI00289A9788|nr:thiolase family protein [Brevundimonas diminuta]